MEVISAQGKGANLKDADLTGAKLEGAKLIRAQLQGAKLTQANLQAAKLNQATLEGADFIFTDLRDADMGEAQLPGAYLASAALQGANFEKANLQGAILSGTLFGNEGVNLNAAQLEGADLRNTSLQGADLSYAKLQGANFANANLKGVDFRNARLQGANFESADLQGVDLRGAEVWLASFPVELHNRWPGPIGGADLDVSPLTAEDKAELKRDLQATAGKLLGTLLDRLDPILRDNPPPWEDEDRWSAFISQAKEEEPSADEIVQFLAGMACDDTEGYIASRMARRVEVYSKDDGRRPYAKPFASALLNENCKGGKALSFEMRATLENLGSAPE
jgi:uncharacterized protein YjbI with pentapeptide repeats